MSEDCIECRADSPSFFNLPFNFKFSDGKNLIKCHYFCITLFFFIFFNFLNVNYIIYKYINKYNINNHKDYKIKLIIYKLNNQTLK